MKIIFLVLLLSQSIQADDLNMEKAKLIIDKVRKEQAPSRGNIYFRFGLLQLDTNTADAVNLNEDGILPFTSIEGSAHVYENFGFEGKYSIAQNILYPSTDPDVNGTSANQQMLEYGFRYKWVIDETRTENYFSFKILGHTVQNNFEVFNPDDSTDDTKSRVYMKSYQAMIFGVERSFYVTPAISLIAGLDMMGIVDAQSDTAQEYEKQGLGFQVRGEVYYRVDWFGVPSRIGGLYWQGGYTNKFKDVDDTDSSLENLGKSRHVQSFRALSVSYSVLF